MQTSFLSAHPDWQDGQGADADRAKKDRATFRIARGSTEAREEVGSSSS